MKVYYYAIFLLAACMSVKTQLIPQVDVPGVGFLTGRVSYSHWSLRKINEFLGIRYAEPPTGSGRFLPPQPAAPLGNFIAELQGNSCPQLLGGIVIGNEDCLNLNVYTPTMDQDAGLPVMVFIHGGAFIGGDGSLYFPERLLENDVVLVVPHYRLGALGFLSLGIDDVPGNAGMIDQVFALRWVREHIQYFGGDPEKVTIFGESAGAVSVAMHLLSPLSSGLFRSAIAESGSALVEWAVDRNPVENAKKVAAAVNCDSDDLYTIAACLRDVSENDLVKAVGDVGGEETLQKGWTNACAAPVIQTAGTTRFLEDEPLTLIEMGNYNQVPAMFGANKNDGSFMLASAYLLFLEPNNFNNAEYLENSYIPDFLESFGVDDPTRATSDAVEHRYLSKADFNNLDTVYEALVDVNSVWYIKAGGYRSVQLQSAFSNSYWYAFNYRGTTSMWDYYLTFHTTPIPGGVTHTDELIYLLFATPLLFSQQDEDVSRKMVDLWTNFATYGEPTPDVAPVDGVPTWPSYNQDTESYLQIDETFVILEDYTNEYTTV